MFLVDCVYQVNSSYFIQYFKYIQHLINGFIVGKYTEENRKTYKNKNQFNNT